MKNFTHFSRLAVQILLVLCCLAGGARLAQADVIDDAIDLYVVAGGENAQYIKDSAGYIKCLVNGDNVLDCTVAFSNTPAGKDAASEAGLPYSFLLFLKAVKYYAEGDYWNFAWSFGGTVACAILQIWTGGWDACGTLMELYEFGKDVYEDYVGPALDWIADAGAAVGCYVFGWGCDEPPPTPPDELAFIENYYRYGCEGVTARESTQPGSYATLLNTIWKSALDTYNCGAVSQMGSHYFGSSIVCSKSGKVCWACRSRTDCDFTSFPFGSTFAVGKCQPRYAGEGPVNVAKAKYETLVKDLWSADVQQRVLKEILQERVNFTVSGIHDAAESAMNSDNPASAVRTFCRGHFRKSQGPPRFGCTLDAQFKMTTSYNYSFDHFDRWIDVMAVSGMTGLPEKNSKWCETVFWDENREKFVAEFKSLVSNNGCPLTGDKFQCGSAEAYKNCGKLLGSVGRAGDCVFDSAKLGAEAAQYVTHYFEGHGSKYPCLTQAAKPGETLKYICNRPTQPRYCEEAYQEFAGKFNLPSAVLQCVQGPPSDAYKAKLETVTNALSGLKPYMAEYPVAGLDNDPLVVGIPQDYWKSMNATQGFSFKEWLNTSIDGVDAPTIWAGKKLSDNKQLFDKKPLATTTLESNLKKTLESGGKPSVDPVNQLAGKGVATSKLVGAGGGAKLAGTADSGAQTQQKVMSGSLPAGSAPSVPGGATTVLGVSTQAAKPHTLPAALPDITVSEQIRVAGMPLAWGGVMTVDAGRAIGRNRNNSGLCEFALEYGVRNAGAAIAGSFRGVWTNSAVAGNRSRTWTSLPAGGSANERDMIQLKPGSNQLLLTLDDLQQLQESNEANNKFRVSINVTGSCDATAGSAGRPVVPVSPAMPPALKPQRGAVMPLQR